MGLLDAIQQGIGIANASNQGVVDAAKARYAFPEEQETLKNAQITNQYLPQKLSLANQYQGLINQYYGPEHQANIDYQDLVNKNYQRTNDADVAAKNAETKFIPLKYAVQAENSMRNNSRFGNAYSYLKSVGEMPAAQRAVWMSDPDNYQTYQQTIGQLHDSMSGGGNQSLITPALLHSVGLDNLSPDIVGAPAPKGSIVSPEVSGVSTTQPQGQATGQAPAQQPATPPVVVNVPQQQPTMPSQPSQSTMSGGLAAPLPNMAPTGAPSVMPSNGLGGAPIGMPPQPSPMPMAAPTMPQAAPQPASQGLPPINGTSREPAGTLPSNAPPLKQKTSNIGNQYGIDPAQANKVANSVSNDNLSPPDKQLLAFQMLANKQMASPAATARALGAVTLEKLLVENKDKFAPAFANAAQYSGLIGSGKLTLDQFRQQHPQEYQDYMWVTNDLIPNLSNNVKVMEKLASSDKQRDALNDMYTASLSWKSDPQMAVKNINRTIDLLGGQARATIEAAEPRYPGVLEKLYDLKTTGPQYVGGSDSSGQSDITKLSDSQLRKLYKEYQNGR